MVISKTFLKAFLGHKLFLCKLLRLWMLKTGKWWLSTGTSQSLECIGALEHLINSAGSGIYIEKLGQDVCSWYFQLSIKRDVQLLNDRVCLPLTAVRCNLGFSESFGWDVHQFPETLPSCTTVSTVVQAPKGKATIQAQPVDQGADCLPVWISGWKPS